MIRVKFQQYECVLSFGKYGNGRLAIKLNDAEDGLPVAVATVNIPEKHFEPDEVAIKSWAENTGMVRCLVDAGVIAEPHRKISLGHVSASVCRLLVNSDGHA